MAPAHGRRWAAVAGIAIFGGAAVALFLACRFEPPARVWSCIDESGGRLVSRDGLFASPGGPPLAGVVADYSDASMVLIEVPSAGALPGAVRRIRSALGLPLAAWTYTASPDVETRGETKWFPYDLDPEGR